MPDGHHTPHLACPQCHFDLWPCNTLERPCQCEWGLARPWIVSLTRERDEALSDKATLADVWTQQQKSDVEEIRDLMAQVDVLRALLREVVDLVEGCHDCINWSDEDDLKTRLHSALGDQ